MRILRGGRATLKKRELKYYINTENRPISRNLSININGNSIHRLNLNMLVVGGSGAGKTQFVVRPCLMQQSGSFVITDPKGEILQTCGQLLEEVGYKILVINLLDANGMAKSSHYNPFKYIRTETDVLKLITNLVANTTPKGATANDPFWTNAEMLLLEALMFYVWMECPEKERNFRKVMDLLEKAEFETDNKGNKLPSELDGIFSELEERIKTENEIAGKGRVCKHPAVLAYNKVMRGAADTVRSIIISANARLNRMFDEILSVLDDDDINIPEIGAGVEFDGKTKTAIFFVIPDNDTTYNFVIGMLYTQMFQQLYFYADFISGKRSLPIHVTFLIDEFCNIALPEDFLSLLSTMRSRNLSSVIFIQAIAQIKEMYQGAKWEEIPANCDTLLYLGGNESGAHEYISKALGEGTYDKDTRGVTRGSHGSSSQNFDKFGRKLLTESEVREIDNNDCLIFIKGYKPLRDQKYDTFNHPLWYKVANANYQFDGRKRHNQKSENEPFGLVSSKKFEAMKNKENYDNELKNDDEKVIRCFEFSYEEFMSIDTSYTEDSNTIFNEKRLELNRTRIKKQAKEEYDNSIEGIAGKYLLEVMKIRKEGFSFEQIKVLMPLLKSGKPVENILKSFSKNMSVEEIGAYVDMMLIKR